MVSGKGNLPYQERLDKLGLTSLQVRRERGDMIDTYKILSGKVDVQPDIWFTTLGDRVGAASTMSTIGRREAKLDVRLHKFSVRDILHNCFKAKN